MDATDFMGCGVFSPRGSICSGGAWFRTGCRPPCLWWACYALGFFARPVADFGWPPCGGARPRPGNAGNVHAVAIVFAPPPNLSGGRHQCLPPADFATFPAGKARGRADWRCRHVCDDPGRDLYGADPL